ncbi:hypothetical protein GLU60_01275 [Nanohaloarchaea archaeon H01]|nr:hypothetical protein [Nanohaloarchaea archaeon H01]
MAKQSKKDPNFKENIKINPTWKKIYKQVLNSAKASFPSNFWENKIEEKATQLLRYYTQKNKITPRSISYRDPEKIVKDSNLE